MGLGDYFPTLNKGMSMSGIYTAKAPQTGFFVQRRNKSPSWPAGPNTLIAPPYGLAASLLHSLLAEQNQLIRTLGSHVALTLRLSYRWQRERLQLRMHGMCIGARANGMQWQR